MSWFKELEYPWLCERVVYTSSPSASPTSTRQIALLSPPSCFSWLTYSRSQSLCIFLHFKTSSSGNVSDMTHTAHAYFASMNILVLMFVHMAVLIPQVWTELYEFILDAKATDHIETKCAHLGLEVFLIRNIWRLQFPTVEPVFA